MKSTMTKEMNVIEMGQAARDARIKVKMTYGMMTGYCDLDQRTIRRYENGSYTGNLKYVQSQHEKAIEAYLHNKRISNPNPSQAEKMQMVKEEKQNELLNELTKLAKRMSVVDLKMLVKSLQQPEGTMRLEQKYTEAKRRGIDGENYTVRTFPDGFVQVWEEKEGWFQQVKNAIYIIETEPSN